MGPAGGVAPIAGQIEYRWPISPREERDAAPDDEDLLALLGTGDLRDQARNLAMTTPAADLRDAYRVAAAMTAWAEGRMLSRRAGDRRRPARRRRERMGNDL
jgi:hypothetical protein